MRIGAHVSIAGGLPNAPKNAADWKLETFQMFSRSPRGGKAAAITDDVAAEFKAAMKEHGFDACYIHAIYLVNLASTNKRTYHGSIQFIREELERGSQLGVKYVMMHIGSAKDRDPDDAIDSVVKGLVKILDGYEGSTQLLLENSAGAGSIIGGKFEELAKMLDDKRLKKHKALAGVCFDTQHAFAAGYDHRTKDGFKQVFDEFDAVIGLDRLKMFHANDSKVELGDHKDRHENIGEGHIGKDLFKMLLNEKRLQGKDLILETPDHRDKDAALLKTLRK